MNLLRNPKPLSRLIVLIAAFSILTTQTMWVYSASIPNAPHAGEITVGGPAKRGEKPFVLVNGDAAFSGRTFFSGSTIATGPNSATVDFGKVGRLVIGPGSTLNLSVSANGISGSLSSGDLQVSYTKDVEVKISTPDDTVTSENNRGGSFAVGVTPDGTSVAARKGIVRYGNGRRLAGSQDDDDDDHDHDDWTWVAIVAAGAAVAGLIIYIALRDEDEVVSPVR
jgi:hypothetical protein